MARRSRAPGWSWARPVLGVAILLVLGWRFGTQAFLAPLQRLDGPPVVAAMALAFLSTVCAAWRWRLVSAGLGSDLPLRTAIAAYYRSQFLNLVLPGGVLGDVHRAVRRGRDVGDLSHAARAVVGERCAGQLVQIGMVIVVLLALPSPVRHLMPTLLLGLAVLTGAAAAAWVWARRPANAHSGLSAGVRRVVGPWPGRTWWHRSAPWVVAASVVAAGGHAATFVIAARAAGSSSSPGQLVALAFLVLLAMAVPTHVAGWGPREGVAAWAFAAAGLGATAGLGAAVVYGVLALAGVLPGGVLLGASAVYRRRVAGRGARSARTTRRASSGAVHV